MTVLTYSAGVMPSAVLKSLKGAPPPDGKGGILLQFSVSPKSKQY